MKHANVLRRPMWVLPFVAVGAILLADGNPATDHVKRAFGYQGTLELDGVALNGPVNLELALYPDASATTSIYRQCFNPTVVAGRFNVVLGENGFTGGNHEGCDDTPVSLATVVVDANDLHVGITVLDPVRGRIALQSRQRVLPVPYTFWSTEAANFKVNGTLSTRNINLSGPGLPNAGIWTHPDYQLAIVGAGPEGSRQVNIFDNVNVRSGNGYLEAGDIKANATLSVTGAATFTNNAFFGITTRQMLNLYGTEYGIGVQDSTTYFRSGGHFAWHRGGSHDNGAGHPGGGTRLMWLDSGGSLAVAGGVSVSGNLSVAGKVMSPVSILAAPVVLAFSTDYQAATDGFVIANDGCSSCESGIEMQVFAGPSPIGSSPPASVIRCRVRTHDHGSYLRSSLTCPVRKGEWWRAHGNLDNVPLQFIAFGN